MPNASKKKEKLVKVCPRCGSRNVVRGLYDYSRFNCRNCGFTGPLFPKVTLQEAKSMRVKKVKHFIYPLNKRQKIGFMVLFIVILFLLLLLCLMS
jgi:transposase-like protein